MLKQDIANTNMQMKFPSDHLLTVNELSRWLKVDESTIRKKVCYGKIPHIKIGRLVRFRRNEIEAWINEQSMPSSKRYNQNRAVGLAEGEMQ